LKAAGRPTRWLAAAALACALAACASAEGPGVKLLWVRAGDGRPAEAAALEAAKQSCAQANDPRPGAVNRHYDRIDYAGPIIDCMRQKGYRLVDAAPQH
jgi:hypothetical protein